MIGKLCFVLSIAIAAISCAQANLDKYVETVATGKEGVQQACFVRSTLWDAMRRFAGENIVKELKNDFFRIAEYSEAEIERLHLNHCSEFQRCEMFGRFSIEREFIGKKFVEAQCYIWSKFETLCRLIMERNSTDRQMLDIEKWVCQVSDEQKMRWQDCFVLVARIEAKKQAEIEFYDVILYTEGELQQAKQSLNAKLAVERELWAAHDAEVAKEAHQLIRDRVATHFYDYKICWTNLEAEEERRAREATRQAAARREKKGFLRRVFICTGKSCK